MFDNSIDQNKVPRLLRISSMKSITNVPGAIGGRQYRTFSGVPDIYVQHCFIYSIVLITALEV